MQPAHCAEKNTEGIIVYFYSQSSGQSPLVRRRSVCLHARMAELLSVQVHAPVTLTSVNLHAPSTVPAAGTAPSRGPTGDHRHLSSVPAVPEMDHLKVACGGCTDCAAAPRRLKKVDNVTQDAASGTASAVAGSASSSGSAGAAAGTSTSSSGTRFAYLPKRHAVNIDFYQLTYTVSEGRKKGIVKTPMAR